MIVYLWTAVARDCAVPRGSLGISGDDRAARAAAEQCLRAGEARLAFVEAAWKTLSLWTFADCYEPTGTGWWATPGPVGEVRWVRFISTETGAALRALASSAVPGVQLCIQTILRQLTDDELAHVRATGDLCAAQSEAHAPRIAS